MRGRKPHPTALHVLRGFPSKGKQTTLARTGEEPRPIPSVNAQPPEWLDVEAQAEWRRLAPMLERIGVLTESDTAALAGYCEAWTTWKGATLQIRKWGMVLKGKEGEIPKVSPYVKIAHNALLQMRAFLVEFGMTPSSRARIHAVKASDVPASKWAGLKS